MQRKNLITVVLGLTATLFGVSQHSHAQDATEVASGDRPIVTPEIEKSTKRNSRKLEYNAQQLKRKLINLNLEAGAIRQLVTQLKNDRTRAKERYLRDMLTIARMPYNLCPHGESFQRCSHYELKREFLQRKELLKSQADLSFRVAQRDFSRRQAEINERFDRLNLDFRRLQGDIGQQQ
jgi:hypothetical protein